jgi:bifunctional UDP-N-acetylglucosamine pyrophosphorylase/glucosamine-1-phosphate N-acetyltransferase
MSLEIIILAAGQGTRMRSALPKVLHPLAGKPMLAHVLDTARQLGPQAIHVVYGHGGEQVKQALDDPAVNWVEQAEQLGTGHAVEQAMPVVKEDATVLILYGDVPLITAPTLQGVLGHAKAGLGLLTVELADPTGYGRILRGADGRVLAIVEQKDASAEQLQIREGNTGIMACQAQRLRGWLTRLDNRNAQGEFYLTDVIALAVQEGVEVVAETVTDEDEVAGVNDRLQLAHLERRYQRRCAEALMRDGATLLDPSRFDQRGTVRIGRDVVIDVGVVFEGEVVLGDRVRVGANCVLRDVRIGNDVAIEPMSLIEQAEIGSHCCIGPFARIRPGTRLAEKARVGNFVEIKNSVIGRASKVNHLSYIGDTSMGSEVNIGAGTITCNYDGANKHRTVIGDRAFIGSDSQLVAPVTVGNDATIGAGSTITRDTPEGELTLSRSGQKSIKGWKRPVKRSSDK